MKKKPRSYRVYSVDFKQEAVRRIAQAKTIVGLAQESGIRRKLLYQWRDQFQAGDRVGLERRRGRPPGSRSQTVSPAAPSAGDLRIAELERLLGRKQLEVDFLERAFEQVREQRQIVPAMAARNLSLDRSLALFEGVTLTVEQQCQAAEVSRAGFYRYLQQTVPEQADYCSVLDCRN